MRHIGVVALGLGLGVALVCCLWVGGRLVVAVVGLQQAQAQLSGFRNQLVRSGSPSSTKLQAALQTDVRLASSTAADPLWGAAEHLPLVGPNLRGVTQVSQVLDGLVTSARPVAVAAEGLSLKSLRPSSGIDLEPLKKLPQPMVQLNDAVVRARGQADAIGTAGMLPLLADKVVVLQEGLAQAEPISAEVAKAMPVLYGALGGNGRRYYLLMFQNNAEERASGGNPAVIALLKVYKGRLRLDRQINSSEFPRPFAQPVRTFGAEWAKTYGPHVATYVTNTTFTPDFPQTASMTRAMWQQVTDGSPVDGVVSFDPVALSYLLRATGPITLKGGDVITSKNAVDFLLAGVYAKYPNVKVQNQVFASAAATIFKAVTHGQGGITKYLAQLPQMVQEQRLKAWSVRDSEQALLIDSPLGTMLPKDNVDQTVLGVYNNDDATSKMSYYMDESVTVEARTCAAATPRYTVTNTLTNTLTVAKAGTLSSFVLAHQKDIPFGGDRQWVQLYGPVGAKLTGVTVDGKPVVWGTDIQASLNTNPQATGVDIRRPAVQGELYGRPVGTVSVTIPAGETVKVTGVFEGGTKPNVDVGVSHTPRVRTEPVTIGRAACQ